MTHIFKIPPNAPDELAAELADKVDPWGRVHAVAQLVNRWLRLKSELYPRSEPVTDVEGRAFLVEGPTFIGRAEQRMRGIPAPPAPDLVRMTVRGHSTLDFVFLPDEAEALAEALELGARAARQAALRDDEDEHAGDSGA